MKKILYISRFGFNQDAAGIRVLRVGKLMKECGCDVRFLCLDKEYTFDNCFSLKKINKEKKRSNFIKKIINNMEVFTCFFSLYYAKKKIEEYKPNVVILYNDIGHLTNSLIPYCKKKGIKIGADVTEWYKIPDSYSKFYFIAKFVDNRIQKIDEKMDFIITISPYLSSYYQLKKCNIFEIPPLMENIRMYNEKHFDYKDGSRINIAYAGSPGQKDLIEPLVMAIKEVNKHVKKVHLDLIGIEKKDIMEYLKGYSISNLGINVYGRLPHNDTIKILEKADYTVLLRENLRYAKAGFSTKFAESLSMGIPVICNEVGGADNLLKKNNVGILMKDYKVDTIVATIEKILLQDEKELLIMKKEALALANKIFSIEVYKKEYLKKIR